jgi:hypothetical protein
MTTVASALGLVAGARRERASGGGDGVLFQMSRREKVRAVSPQMMAIHTAAQTR